MEINQEFRIKIYILLYIKQITTKDLPYYIGNYTQYLVITYTSGKEPKKQYIGVLLWLNRLRIWRCHCSSSSHCCGAGQIPGPGFPHATGMAEKKKRTSMHICISITESLCCIPEYLKLTQPCKSISFQYKFKKRKNTPNNYSTTTTTETPLSNYVLDCAGDIIV